MDIKFDIALGSSRKSRQWQNRTWSWEKFCNKIRTPKVTKETFDEYQRKPKSQRDEIKDVGGFVGGYLDAGLRRKANVRHRQLITLDADFAPTGEFPQNFDYLYALYSTHSHTPKKPRYRVIIPLDRPVEPDQYEAIARKVAEIIGMDYFDDTTYDIHRLMHWPSVSKDGEYVCQIHDDAPIMKADDILAMYVDWTDISAWPTSSRQEKVARAYSGRSPENPLNKSGLIGAFCRTYNVRQAIDKFIPDYHEEEDGRYTYTKGSTSHGVVIYQDDLFAYSHHATDPASGRLCNAWDLVRLHLFHDLDHDIKPDTKASDLPSFKKMTDLAYEDPNVKALYSVEMFEDKPEENQEESSDAWMQQLDLQKKGGGCITNVHNIRLILENDPRLKDIFLYDEFGNRTFIRRSFDWKEITEPRRTVINDWSIERNYFDEKYKIRGKLMIEDVTNEILARNRFDPLKQYINGLPEWDGIERVDALLIDYLGVADTPLNRKVTRKTLCAAVARALNPGLKFDNMLIISGDQGIGKSMLWNKLGMDWFSDNVSNFKGDKNSEEQVIGVWIIEVAELASFRKAEVDELKRFLSMRNDDFRPAYGRDRELYPRRCIFVGTTNDENFLTDVTGNRRYWPVYQNHAPIKRSWEMTQDEVDQIWAEALTYWMRGEDIYLTHEEEVLMNIQRERAEDIAPTLPLIEKYLEMKVPKNWMQMSKAQRILYTDNYSEESEEDTKDIRGVEEEKEELVEQDIVCAMQIWVEVYHRRDVMNRFAAREINAIIRRIPGWEQKDYRIHCGTAYGKQKAFKRRVE